VAETVAASLLKVNRVQRPLKKSGPNKINVIKAVPVIGEEAKDLVSVTDAFWKRKA
jgi:ribosomal protein L7/L12